MIYLKDEKQSLITIPAGIQMGSYGLAGQKIDYFLDGIARMGILWVLYGLTYME